MRAWEFGGRVATMSRPDPNEGIEQKSQHQLGRRERSVGRFLPGIAGRIEDDTLLVRFQPEGTPLRDEDKKSDEESWIRAGVEAKIDEENFVYLTDLQGL